jgi:hypothetical protein
MWEAPLGREMIRRRWGILVRRKEILRVVSKIRAISRETGSYACEERRL